MNNPLSNIELEKVVLGNLIENPNLYYSFAYKINSSLFSATNNRQIFEIIYELQDKNKPIDLLIIQSEITRKGLALNDYLTQIINDTVSTSNFEHYLTILIELSVKREFIFKFGKLLKLANQSDEDVYQIREKAIEEFNNLFIDRFIEANRNDIPFSDLVEKVENKFTQIQEGVLTGIPSSLDIINKAFGGWQPSDLTIVAGRPGMGKSAFMVQQIMDVTSRGMSAGVFSLEMSSEQITARIVTNYTSIPNSAILRKGLQDIEMERYLHFKPSMQSLNIHIDDTPNISIQNLRIKAKMMKMRYNIDILMVDYLQLVTNDKSPNREQEVSKISRSLKALAKELNIPVIALAQLSRYVEQRGGDKRPMLADLRDSGAIEQDADEVIFLYRPEYYGIEYWHDYNEESTEKQAEIIIAKNRHGGILSERCKVDLAISKFQNLPTFENFN